MKRVFIQQLLTENTQSCVCFYINAPVLKLSSVLYNPRCSVSIVLVVMIIPAIMIATVLMS